MEDPRFRATLDRAESEIREAMASSRRVSVASSTSSAASSSGTPAGPDTGDGRQVADADAREVNDDGDDVLRVGCMCGSGHHRSVAFAGVQEKQEWPDGWHVELEPRQLTAEVSGRKTEVRKEFGS